VWNDDAHHSAIVALTGRNPAYYSDYHGTPQELISAVKYGYLYQGQRYHWQRKRRGTPGLDLPPESFVAYLENHDQVANSIDGARTRLLTSPGRYRAMTALLLLAPWTPLLFQGQEFGATTPFLYFADVNDDLRESVRKGRFDFLKQFPGVEAAEVQAQLADPSSVDTFRRCKLNFDERTRFPEITHLYRDLIRLRREDQVLGRQGKVDGAVLAAQAFVLRFFDSLGEEDRLLLVNLGRQLQPTIVPEPLLAPPDDCHWAMLWSSERLRYGGRGVREVETEEGWELPAESAIALRAVKS
jgi:maltooligosyltrehalose trehalohydrolase